MASKLKPLDLTGATVGTSGTIDFNSFLKFNPSNMQDKAHLRLLNESGCGVDVVFNASGNSHTLPAGGWGTFELEPNDSNIKATVIYVLPNPPVSMLIGIYYAPGESVPATFTLGNSPIGIGGTIPTSNTTLVNQANPINTPDIIQISPAGDAGNTTTLDNMGNMVLGDATNPGGLTVNGTLTIHSVNTISGDNLIINGDSLLDIFFNRGVNRSVIIQENGANVLQFTSLSIRFVVAANDGFLTAVTGRAVFVGDIATSTAVKLSATGIKLLGNGQSIGFNVGSIKEFNSGTVVSAVATVAVNHGLSSTPSGVWVEVDSAGSATHSASAYTSTQFTLTNGAQPTSFTFLWVAYRT